MKRTTTEVLRRGLYSTAANWPLIVIRIAESVLAVMIVLGSIVAAIVPVAVAAGLSRFDFQNKAESIGAIEAMLVSHWMLIVFVLLLVSAVLALLIGIHSFVDAGTARVFVEAERAVGNNPAPQRDGFRAFTMDRWMQGGRTSWWSVFWIYNLAWSAGGVIILVPLAITLAAMLLVQGTEARLALGCGGLALCVLIMIPVGVAIAIWTHKAIAVAVGRTVAAGTALRLGWREMSADFSRHLAVALIIIAVAFGGAMVISFASLPLSIARGQSAFSGVTFAPAQIVISLTQSIFSSAVGLWFLAAFVGLTEER